MNNLIKIALVCHKFKEINKDGMFQVIQYNNMIYVFSLKLVRPHSTQRFIKLVCTATYLLQNLRTFNFMENKFIDAQRVLDLKPTYA